MKFENIDKRKKEIICESLPFLRDFDIKEIEIRHDWQSIFDDSFNLKWGKYTKHKFPGSLFYSDFYKIMLNDFKNDVWGWGMPSYIFFINRNTETCILWVIKEEDHQAIIDFVKAKHEADKRVEETCKNAFRDGLKKALSGEE